MDRAGRDGVSGGAGCVCTFELFIARKSLNVVVPVLVTAIEVRKVLNYICGADADEVSSASRLLKELAVAATLSVGLDRGDAE